ncbi:hypothetical protein BCR39DRAFT_460973, partial [Naematelia encephala]
MVTHWLLHTHNPADIPLLRSRNSHIEQYHTTADRLQVPLVSVEAMDDSIFFSSSWEGLKRIVTRSEQFQRAYGIETAWDSPDKTACFTFGAAPRDPPTHDEGNEAYVRFAINGQIHRVPYSTTPEILRTRINEPLPTLDKILAIVDAIPFPPQNGLPLSLLRKAAWAVMLPAIRPRLELQPLSPGDAIKVDQAITRKVAHCMNWEYTTSPILSLPINKHGFGFPSIYRINGEIAINMIVRSLNHHLPAIRDMARISLANWECYKSGCANPLEQALPGSQRRTTARPSSRHLPAAWIFAKKYLDVTRLSILATNQTGLGDGSASLYHLATKANSNRRAWTMGISSGDWVSAGVDTATPINDILTTLAERASHGEELAAWILATLSNSGLQDALVTWDRSSHRPIHERKKILAATIRSATLRTRHAGARAPDIWASDGSHIHCTTETGLPSTTAIVTGPTTTRLQLVGQVSTSAHGEIVALIAAIQATQSSRVPDPKILTDYLGGLRAVQDIRTPDFNQDTWRSRKQGALYRWLAHTVTAGKRRVPTITHVKAHTDEKDSNSILNDRADKVAKATHNKNPTKGVARLGPATAFMAPFVPYHHEHGYAPDEWPGITETKLIEQQLTKMTVAMRLRLSDGSSRLELPTPGHFYTSSAASYLVKIQYHARVGMLWCDYSSWRQGTQESPACRLCGASIGDLNHVFLHCPNLRSVRDEA